MSRLERNNAAALKAGQFAWDSAAPDDSLDFLETTEGENWLYGAGLDLVIGRDLKINGFTCAESYLLADKLAEMTLAAHESDEDGALGQMLHALAGGNFDMAQRYLYALVSKNVIQQAAEDLCSPFADAYVESMQEDF